MHVAVSPTDDDVYLVPERPTPSGNPRFPEASKDALESDAHEADRRGALSGLEGLRESLDLALPYRSVPIMLKGQAVSVGGTSECYRSGTGIQCVLHEFEDVDPVVFEDQLKRTQPATAIESSPFLVETLYGS